MQVANVDNYRGVRQFLIGRVLNEALQLALVVVEGATEGLERLFGPGVRIFGRPRPRDPWALGCGGVRGNEGYTDGLE